MEWKCRLTKGNLLHIRTCVQGQALREQDEEEVTAATSLKEGDFLPTQQNRSRTRHLHASSPPPPPPLTHTLRSLRRALWFFSSDKGPHRQAGNDQNKYTETSFYRTHK